PQQILQHGSGRPIPEHRVQVPVGEVQQVRGPYGERGLPTPGRPVHHQMHRRPHPTGRAPTTPHPAGHTPVTLVSPCPTAAYTPGAFAIPPPGRPVVTGLVVVRGLGPADPMRDARRVLMSRPRRDTMHGTERRPR